MADSKKAVIATELLSDFSESKVKELFEKRPWMLDKKYHLVHKRADVEELIDLLIQKGLCSLDFETTGLNTRVDAEGKPLIKIVGVALAWNGMEGYYIPVNHQDKEYNVPEHFVIEQLKKLVTNCRTIYHNFKYDGQVFWNEGIHILDADAFEDTLLMAGVVDAGNKRRSLKELSKELLNREMIEITDMGIKGGKGEDVVSFDLIPPQVAVFYAGSDAMNTFALYEYYKAKLDEQDPGKKKGPWMIYEKVEKRCLFATMEMERNLSLVDKEYLLSVRQDLLARREKLLETIYQLAGRKFDVNSPKQLGQILFVEMGLKYPSDEKSKTDQYKTGEEILVKIADAPIVNSILTFRGYEKIIGTYIDNFLANMDENREVKFQLNQLRADTGRFSSSGGKGLKVDGYSGVNCQNIPTFDKDDPNSIDLRKAVIAHPGYKIASIDYSGEELRIAANYSQEPKWLNEFLYGTGDLHSITTRIIYNKPVVTKEERAVGKTLNFLTMYGGSAGGFARKAKIPYEQAKKMIINFFRDYKVLKKWIADEIVRSKKRGYSQTALGRRRPLAQYFNSGDPKLIAYGERCAVNASIQGAGSDIIKIAMYRIWKWIHDNNFQDDVRMLMPVHDEIVFEIKEDKLSFLIPEICEIMRIKDVIKMLGWQVPLEVDAEYGDTFHVDHDFTKELNNGKFGEKHVEKEQPMTTASSDQTKKDEPVAIPPVTVQENNPPPIQEVKEEKVVPQGVTIEMETIVSEQGRIEGSCNDTPGIYFKSTIRDAVISISDDKKEVKKAFEMMENESAEIDPALQNIQIKDMIDKRGVLIYPMENLDPITSEQLKTVLKILIQYGNMFSGPKCKVCITTNTGEVWYESSKKLSVDAFLALCTWLKI